MEYARTADVIGTVRGSVADAAAHKKALEGRLKVLAGVEIGEELWDRESTARLREAIAGECDVILGSVHAVRMEGYLYPFSGLKFSEMPRGRVPEFLHRYFADLHEMIDVTDVDVMCHLTVPLRYVVGKYGIHVDLGDYDADIDAILRTAAARDLAFELNTSCTGTAVDSMVSDIGYAARFKAYGGRKFTVGSDAHAAARVGIAFDRAVGLYASIGVKELCYFEKRRPVFYPIGE